MEGTIAAADAIVRTGPPLAEAVVLLGTPWLSKEVADYVGRCAAEGAHVAAADPWWQWTDPSHVVKEFYRSHGDAWVEAAWRRRNAAERSRLAAAVAIDGGRGPGGH